MTDDEDQADDVERPAVGDLVALYGSNPYGYAAGFAAGVQAGYREVRRDLELAKSEAASAGWHRATEAAVLAEDERTERMRELVRLGLLGLALGYLTAGVVARRRAAVLEEIPDDEEIDP